MGKENLGCFNCKASLTLPLGALLTSKNKCKINIPFLAAEEKQSPFLETLGEACLKISKLNTLSTESSVLDEIQGASFQNFGGAAAPYVPSDPQPMCEMNNHSFR